MQFVIPNLSKQRFAGHDFSNRDLRKANLRNSIFLSCNFDNSDLSEADCEGSDFSGSSFRGSILYKSRFIECNMSEVVFEPKDAYGVVLSFTCSTFKDLQMGQLWWMSWLLMLAKTFPTDGPIKEPLRDKLLSLIGAERYVKLSSMFQRREL